MPESGNSKGEQLGCPSTQVAPPGNTRPLEEKALCPTLQDSGQAAAPEEDIRAPEWERNNAEGPHQEGKEEGYAGAGAWSLRV